MFFGRKIQRLQHKFTTSLFYKQSAKTHLYSSVLCYVHKTKVEVFKIFGTISLVLFMSYAIHFSWRRDAALKKH